MTVLRAFELLIALCESARAHPEELTLGSDSRFQQASSAFLDAAHSLAPKEQHTLQQQMHEFGCPFPLRHYEAKVLFDFPWWRPSTLAEPLLSTSDSNATGNAEQSAPADCPEPSSLESDERLDAAPGSR